MKTYKVRKDISDGAIDGNNIFLDFLIKIDFYELCRLLLPVKVISIEEVDEDMIRKNEKIRGAYTVYKGAYIKDFTTLKEAKDFIKKRKNEVHKDDLFTNEDYTISRIIPITECEIILKKN